MSTPASGGPNSDRNLLFGILALQADLVGRDALLNAMSAWALAKSRPLGDILVEQGGMDVDSRSLVEALVKKSLARHEGDAAKGLMALQDVGSVNEQLGRIADPDLNASLALVNTVPKGEDPHATFALAGKNQWGQRQSCSARYLRPDCFCKIPVFPVFSSCARHGICAFWRPCLNAAPARLPTATSSA